MKRANEVLLGSVEAGFVPIAEDGGGNHILLEIGTSRVVLWDHEVCVSPPSMADMKTIAGSFEEFEARILPDDTAPTPCHEKLAETGSIERVRAYLLTHDVNQRDEAGLTLAQACAREGDGQLLRECRASGASLDGCIALAGRRASREVVEYLLREGCGINDLFVGDNILYNARLMSREPEFIAFLKEKGAK